MKKEYLTIPNMMSIFRILLIPLIIWLYQNEKYIYAGSFLIASGLTDILDGYIARRTNQVSDIGKILDPLADKLTQLIVAATFVAKYKSFLWIFLLLFAKELYMSIAGLILIKKKGKPFGSFWWGKLSTILLYIYMLLIVFLHAKVNDLWILRGGIICAIALIFSLIKYINMYRDVLKTLKQETQA